ncbi:hypothetical protein ACB094_01G172400 [Castanea mollissima]
MNIIKALKVFFMVEAAILLSKFTASSSPSNASSRLTSVSGGVWFCSLHICCISCSTACGSTQPSAITCKLQTSNFNFNLCALLPTAYCLLLEILRATTISIFIVRIR